MAKKAHTFKLHGKDPNGTITLSLDTVVGYGIPDTIANYFYLIFSSGLSSSNLVYDKESKKILEDYFKTY